MSLPSKNDVFSSWIVKAPRFLVAGGKVVLDERYYTENLFQPSILKRLLPDVLVDDHQRRLSAYFNYMRYYAPPVVETPVKKIQDTPEIMMAFTYRSSDSRTNIIERM
jgi:hypothetical protein